MSSPARVHRPDLDGLRALAVIAVVVHHVTPTTWRGGFAGVDVFFVLSGFLITGLLVDEIDAGRFSWVGFLLRRARRLLPAFALVLVATLLAGAALLSAAEYSALGWQAVAAALSVANIQFHREVGYFDTAAATKPLLHLWSLGVEEQFYLAWPAILLVGARWPRARIAITGVLCVASMATAVALSWHDPAAAFYLLPPRAWELLAGALLALAHRDGLVAPAPRQAVMLSWLGAATLALGLWLPHADAGWPGPATLLPVLGTVLVIAAGADAPVNRVVLGWRPARWLGLRSYPLYLWHWPLLAFLHTLAPELALDDATIRYTGWGLAAIALLLAHLTYLGVELPVQRAARANRDGRPPTFATLSPWGLLLVGLGSMGATIVGHDGLPERYTSGEIDETVNLTRATRRGVERAAWEGTVPCVPQAEMVQGSWCLRHGRTARIAVLGDSHGEGVFAMLVRALPREGLLLVGRPGCAPTLLPDTTERDAPRARPRVRCRRAMARAHELIAREDSVHTVVLASRDAYQVTGTPFGRDGSTLPVLPIATEPARPDTLALTAAWEQGMARTIDRLHRAGKRVILVVDWPELGFDPRRCIAHRPLVRRPAIGGCAVPHADFAARTASYRAAVARLATRFPSLVVHDASRSLCDATGCAAMARDTLLYYDDDHLSLAGLDRALAGLVPLLASPPLVARR